jgi:hypothetical protein
MTITITIIIIIAITITIAIIFNMAFGGGVVHLLTNC